MTVPGRAAAAAWLWALASIGLAACTQEDRPAAAPAVDATATTAGATSCADPASCTTRQLAKAAGVTLGTAVAATHLDETNYRRALVETFTSVTPEYELKWSSIQPEPGAWDFGPMDRIVAFAEEHGLEVKGHALVWDQVVIGSTPEWVLQIDDPDELRQVLEEHIGTVMDRYASTVDRWDVVNEPLDTVGAGLHENHFHRVLGEDYLAEVFAIARRASPDARLFLNEAAVEYQPAKAAALVALVEDLVDRGVPIDGVGLQGHLVAGTVEAGVLRDLVGELEALGVEVAITELDVPTTDAADPLALQATTYAGVLDACFAHACREITTWGFTDRYTWIDGFLGPGRAPLPFDRSYRPKPALDAIRHELVRLAG